MKRASLLALVVALTLGAARPPQTAVSKNKNIGPPSSGFPRTLKVRLWYLHPPVALKLGAASGQAHFRTCSTCKDAALTSATLRASGTRLKLDSEKRPLTELRLSGVYQMKAADGPPVPADFPVDIRASGGRLLVTATMPMDEYIAGVLAGETGNFKSDEALKAMSVAARTYAMHFGSRHALDHFDVCDTTHCQDLRLSGITSRMRQIAESTSGEVLWYNGRPAATYYHADCGGMTEDARFVIGDDEPPMPYLIQHSDVYCIRHGIMQWQSEITKRDLQRALTADGFTVPGTLRSISVVQRTPSGRIETVRVVGSRSITIPGVAFRIAVGRHLGWARLKSNWYDVSISGDRIAFHGRGSGHGVGLCQVGAEVMGEEGKTYQEILAYYYPGTRLGRSAQGIAWHTLTGENIELLTTRPDVDRAYLPLAASLARQAAATTGLTFALKAPVEALSHGCHVSRRNRRAGMGGGSHAWPHHTNPARGRAQTGWYAGQYTASRAAAHAHRIPRQAGHAGVVSRRAGVVFVGAERIRPTFIELQKRRRLGKRDRKSRQRRSIAQGIHRGALNGRATCETVRQAEADSLGAAGITARYNSLTVGY